MNYEEAIERLSQMDKLAYPPLFDVKPDLLYANRVRNDFAGVTSEMSSICQYVYEEIVFRKKQHINQILNKIAQVEMKHLALLGNLMSQLGGEPYYINSFGNAWNANCIYYQTEDFVKVMKYNIEQEQIAIVNYEQEVKDTNNHSIKELFKRIILDEKTHIRIFSMVANDYENF